MLQSEEGIDNNSSPPPLDREGGDVNLSDRVKFRDSAGNCGFVGQIEMYSRDAKYQRRADGSS